METWAEIPGFPDYSVSDQGRVVNENSGRFLTLATNQQGYRMAFLRSNGQQFTRSVTMLVANAFLRQQPDEDHFDSVIHLDGNKSNLRVSNLRRRPRWFAIQYHRQFEYFRFHRKLHPNGIEVPIVDVDSGEEFDNSAEAAMRHGLLELAVIQSVHNGTRAFPYGKGFTYA